MSDALPIDALRPRFLDRAGQVPLVVTAPPGAGKSTAVPRWAAESGRVLVVEPRRVACRSLAARVAELEGETLGARVGYAVRGERRASDRTRLLFVTPGIALRMIAGGDLAGFDRLVLDEFHERTLDVDLILALAARERPRDLVVMSATLAAEPLAARLGAEHLHAEGRVFPVDVRYLPQGTLLPEAQGLDRRVAAAVEAARDLPGDVLVFLPGKGEIAACARALAGRDELEILPLHGGLSLGEQGRVFRPGRKKRVILATNVAETSLTLPRVGVVVDSGLVRQTRYRDGRGFLTLVPIALDSADQRAGRAGRTAPGTCLRLWDPAARLEAVTPPEVHRESLVPLVLGAAACGARAEDLPFPDPPRDHALDAAREELAALGALDAEGALTRRGGRLFGLPLDPWIGTFLVEAERQGHLEDAVDLACALTVDRSPFGAPADPEDETDPRHAGDDAQALVAVVRAGRPGRHGVRGEVLADMRAVREQLRGVFGLDGRGPTGAVDREALARVLLAADPRVAHVARSRKREVAWSNGGTEAVLGRESAVDPQKHPLLAVLGTRALGVGARERRILITAAMPLTPAWAVAAGLGRDRLAGMEVSRGRVVARIERVYAGRVLDTREAVPEGPLAREAVRDLVLRGSLFKGLAARLAEDLEAWALAHRLQADGRLEILEPLDAVPADVPEDPGAWLLARLAELGLERGDELSLITAEDLAVPPLPESAVTALEWRWPRRLKVGDAAYRLRYDLGRREVRVEKLEGSRKAPPPPEWLPKLPGFAFTYVDGNRVIPLKAR